MRDLRAISGPVGRLTLVMSCVFAGTGVSLPFLARWLEGVHHLSGVEIAVVVSSAQLARIFIGPLIASWADGFDDRRTPLRWLAVVALALYAAFFHVVGFWALVMTSFLAQTAGQAMTPLLEGAILRRSMAGGMSYGFARGIGSVAFIISNVVGGAMVARFGLGAVAIWVLASMGAAAVSALLALQPDSVVHDDAPSGFRQRLKEALGLFRKPSFAIPVAAASLIQCAHAFYYGFSTLVWAKQGFSDTLIGWLWGFGTLIEVGLLWTLPRFEKRFTPEALIALGGGAAAVRWTAMAFLPPPLLLWPLQALHALTFAAAHVGALKLVQREAPARVASVAQTLYAGLASGTLAGLSMLLAGALYDAGGVRGYFAMAALGGLGFIAMAFVRPARLVGAKPETATFH